MSAIISTCLIIIAALLGIIGVGLFAYVVYLIWKGDEDGEE